MKIALISNWYSENMGYSENILPKALAHLGHEVHLISSTAQVYYNSPFYQETYGIYLGPPVVPAGSKEIDGYTLHRLPFNTNPGIVITGLVEKIAQIGPDIVQTFDIDINVHEVALAKERQGFGLFTEMHLHASIFPNYRNRSFLSRLKWYYKLGRHLKVINGATTLCYPIAEDCADIARVIYHVPQNKIRVQSLGTDTQLFKPCTTSMEVERRTRTRRELGFLPDDIVCIYTGRITKDKGPALLARAITLLQDKRELNYRALFVGIGEEEEMKIIRESNGCVIKDFVRAIELPQYYQASDIAVWPYQESTSQLDAIACGLPLIINDSVTVRRRVEGNGLFYKLGDVDDLAAKLIELKSESTRREMGENGVKRADAEFSWIKLARERVRDYQAG